MLTGRSSFGGWQRIVLALALVVGAGFLRRQPPASSELLFGTYVFREGTYWFDQIFPRLDRLVSDLANAPNYVAHRGAAFVGPDSRLDIQMSRQDLYALSAARDQAMLQRQRDKRQNVDVSALLGWNNRSYVVDIGLAGLLPDHFLDAKWSLDVKLKSPGDIGGYRSFHLLAPYTRDYLQDWILHLGLRETGNLVLETRLVHLRINQVDMGIYLLEPKLDADTLEYNGVSRSAAIFLTYDHPAGTGLDPIYPKTTPLVRHLDARLEGWFAHQVSTADVFDISSIANLLAWVNLSYGEHSLDASNFYLVYDPIADRISILASEFAARPADVTPLPLDGRQSELRLTSRLVRAWLADSDIRAAMYRQLQVLIQPGYLERLYANHRVQVREQLKILWSEYPGESSEPENFLYANAAVLRTLPFAQAQTSASIAGQPCPAWLSATPETEFASEQALSVLVRGQMIVDCPDARYVAPGTTFRFADAAVLRFRSSVSIRGRREHPVSFRGAVNASVVFERPGKYVLEYVRFEGFTRDPYRAAILPTGAVTFWNTSGIMQHASWSDNHTEDGLHLFNSVVTGTALRFVNHASDSIDADFSRVQFVDLHVKNSGNDGIDLGSSSLVLKHAVIQMSGDKGISVGDHSQCDLADVTLGHTTMGIAMKDGSGCTAQQVFIGHTVTAVAGYNKTHTLDAAYLTLREFQGQDNAFVAAVTDGARIAIDGQSQWPQLRAAGLD